jgi:hypothetical protein
MNKKKTDSYLFNMIEDTLIGLWKDGKIVRSSNPDTKSGDYYYTTPDKAKVASRSNPAVGPYLTYEEFQSQIN